MFHQKHNKLGRTATLHLQDITFPNHTLDLSKYNGKYQLTEISVSSSIFRYIHALIPPHQYNVRHIRITSNTTIESLSAAVFTSHQAIEKLWLGQLNIVHLQCDLLRPLHATLTNFDMRVHQITCSLDDLFGYKTEWNIHTMLIAPSVTMPMFRVLAPSNFSSLTRLRHLMLFDFDLLVIKPSTFDRLGPSLTYLSLRSTKHVTAIDSRLFNRIIDKPLTTALYIETGPNPFGMQCNCDLLEVIGVMRFNYQPGAFTLIEHNVCLRVIYFYERATCAGLQVINKIRFCVSNRPFRLLLYPKFRLHVDAATQIAIIRTDKWREFRLLVVDLTQEWNVAMDLCPVGAQLLQSMRCFRFGGTEASVALDAIAPQFKYANLCVSYVKMGTKNVWPLHCITRYRPPDTTPRYSIGLVAIGAAVAGICCSLLLIRPAALWAQTLSATEMDENDGRPAAQANDFNQGDKQLPGMTFSDDDESIEYESIDDLYVCVIE